MSYIGTNIVAILVATLAGLVVGALALRLRGDMTSPRPFGVGGFVLIVVAEFWLASILAGALILAPSAQAGPWTMAIGSAVVIWIGFVLPTQIVSGLARLERARSIAFDCVHWLLVMVLQAVVLQAIGLKHP